MSVLIKMEMPSGCDKCPFMWGNCIIDEKDECYGRVHYNDVVVRISGNKYAVRKDRPSWCPILCQLPERHGRLIEENKVLDIVFEWCPDDDGSVGKVADLREMLDEIEALPIIEAEECE